jgi:hypothetical protein
MGKIMCLQHGGAIAREAFTVLMLSVLFLVTGCGSSDNYTPNASLAPPPPFMTGPQAYGPEVPPEIAMLMIMDNIMPAAGGEVEGPEVYGPVHKAKCFTGVSFAETGSEVNFGFGGLAPARRERDLSFSSLHNGGSMMFNMTFSLPSPVKVRPRACE